VNADVQQQVWELKAEAPQWIVEFARHEQSGFVERWAAALLESGVDAVNVTFNGGWPDVVSLDTDPGIRFDSAKSWPFENAFERLLTKRQRRDG
jgi:hypothetical protein